MVVPQALLLAAAATMLVVDITSGSSSVTLHRDERFLFTSSSIVCQGNAGHQGACLPYFRCDNYDGQVEGACQVVGQCCVVQRSCGESSPARITYFNSKLLSITDGGTCSLTLTTPATIAPTEICQLHLELDKVELSEPTADGACERQYLEVKGGTQQSIKICGSNRNQSLVVDVKGREGPFKVSVVTLNAADIESEWEVKVMQVPCDSENLAPSGCDQYLTGLTGEVKSFNYASKPSSRTHAGKKGSRTLQESYTICVRQEEGYCSLKWTAKENDNYAFTITGNLDNPIKVFGVELNEDCNFTDYLLITEANVEGEKTATTVICGSKFPPAVFTTSFRVRVEANGKEFADDDLDNRGFHLQYEQQKC